MTVKYNFCSRVRNAAKEVAKEYGINSAELTVAAVRLQQEEKESLKELIAARRIAREYTGLSLNFIHRLEDSGKDYSSVRELDVKAREIAGMFPILGIGDGYVSDSQYDDNDYAMKLYDLLRQPDPVIRSQHDQSLVREAAEMIFATIDTVPF